ncbi:hypothetical protein ACROYT_G029917 [Oculina patagonica]
MKTLHRFINEDDMDFDEAAESAVEKRKFLLNRVMRKKLVPYESDDDEGEEEKTPQPTQDHTIVEFASAAPKNYGYRYKRYMLVFDKRVVDTKDYLSYPYGYQPCDEEEEEMLRELSVAWEEQDYMSVELLCEL